MILEDIMALRKRVEERASLSGSLLLRTYSSASSQASLLSHKSVSAADGLVLTAEAAENVRGGSKNHYRNSEQEKIITIYSREKSEDISINTTDGSERADNSIITASSSEKADASGKEKSTSDDDWELLRREVYSF